jgi:hypothetical protein
MTWTEKAIRLVEESGRSHEEIERSAGLEPGTLERAIADPEAPRADLAIRLAAALGTDAAWLFEDAREWKARPRPVPQVTVHGVSEMPSSNNTQKWQLADWDAAKAAVAAGKAISVKVSPAERDLVRTIMYQRLGRLRTRYDDATQCLWACRAGVQEDYLASLYRAEKSRKEDKAAGSAAGTLD